MCDHTSTEFDTNGQVVHRLKAFVGELQQQATLADASITDYDILEQVGVRHLEIDRRWISLNHKSSRRKSHFTIFFWRSPVELIFWLNRLVESPSQYAYLLLLLHSWFSCGLHLSKLATSKYQKIITIVRDEYLSGEKRGETAISWMIKTYFRKKHVNNIVITLSYTS